MGGGASFEVSLQGKTGAKYNVLNQHFKGKQGGGEQFELSFRGEPGGDVHIELSFRGKTRG